MATVSKAAPRVATLPAGLEALLGEQGDGPRVRVRRRRQDHVRRRPRPGGGCRAGRQGARADRRPGPPAGRLARVSAGSATWRRGCPMRRLRSTGVDARGELWAAMLDTKAGWDELIRRHAPDAEGPRLRADQPALPEHHQPLRAQPRLPRHGAAPRPSMHRAPTTSSSSTRPRRATPSTSSTRPSRMVDFFGSRLLRWLTVPYRSRLFNLASKPFNQIADRVLGSRFLQDIAEFFILFQAMEGGFVRRAREVEALLGDPRTTFVVVTTLEAAPAHEAGFLVRELAQRQYIRSARVIANRVMPAALTSRAAATSARRLAAAASGNELAVDVAAAVTRSSARYGDASMPSSSPRADESRRELPRRLPSSRRGRRSAVPSWPPWLPKCRCRGPAGRRPRSCRTAGDRRRHARNGRLRAMASLAGLVRENTSLDREQVEPPQPADVGVGPARRRQLLRPAALRPDQGRSVADHRPDPPGDGADRLPHRLGRHVRQRHRTGRAQQRAQLRGDHRRRRDRRGARRSGADARHPGAPW